MKLFEEFDTQYLGSERYSLYQHNKADTYLLRNSLKFFLLNTDENNIENCLMQYEFLKFIDASPIIFAPNLDYFINNNIPEKNLVETDGFSYLNCFNEVIKHTNSNYVFLINSNIMLDNIDDIVNRFYITHQNFSDKIAGWSVDIINNFKNKTYYDFKIDENIYFSPKIDLDFFCIKSEYLKKAGLLSYVRENEECCGLDYLLGWLIHKNDEYVINDFNIKLNSIEKKEKQYPEEKPKTIEEKLNTLIEKQYFFFDINKNVYNLDNDFFGFWRGNIIQAEQIDQSVIVENNSSTNFK